MADPQGDPGSTSDREERPLRSRPTVRIVVGILLVAGMIYGWTMMGRQKSRKQAEAVNAVTTAGGLVYFDYQWKDGKYLAEGQPQQAAWLAADYAVPQILAVRFNRPAGDASNNRPAQIG